MQFFSSPCQLRRTLLPSKIGKQGKGEGRIVFRRESSFQPSPFSASTDPTTLKNRKVGSASADPTTLKDWKVGQGEGA